MNTDEMYKITYEQHPKMAILKNEGGLTQLYQCPVCGFMVLSTDMYFADNNTSKVADLEPVGCRYCEERGEVLPPSKRRLNVQSEL